MRAPRSRAVVGVLSTIGLAQAVGRGCDQLCNHEAGAYTFSLHLRSSLCYRRIQVGGIALRNGAPDTIRSVTFAFGGQIRSPLYSALALATVRFPQQPIDSLTGI